MILKARAVCSAIEDEDAEEYYRKVADELERIAESVCLHPELDHDLSDRLRAFARQIRQDSGFCLPPCSNLLN